MDTTLAEIVGPVYSPRSTYDLLGLNSAELFGLVCEGQVLELITADGQYVYPVFQFSEGVLQHLPSLLPPLFQSGADGWTIAAWFKTPAEALEGKSPHEWLSDTNNDPYRAIDLGKDIASLWSE